MNKNVCISNLMINMNFDESMSDRHHIDQLNISLVLTISNNRSPSSQ